MQQQPDPPKHRYTCQEYREEMILAALQRALQKPDLPEDEYTRIREEIKRLEKAMDL